MKQVLKTGITTVSAALCLSALCGPAPARGASTIRIESPNRHLSRLSRSVDLSETQQKKIKRILTKSRSEIRSKIRSRDDQIRALLDDDQAEAFEEFQSSSNRQTKRTAPKPRFRTIQNAWGSERSGGGRGQQGGMGQGQQGGMGRGQQGGMGRGQQGGMGYGPQGGMGGGPQGGMGMRQGGMRGGPPGMMGRGMGPGRMRGRSR